MAGLQRHCDRAGASRGQLIGIGHRAVKYIAVAFLLIDAFYQLSDEQSIKELEEKIRTFHRDNNAGSEYEP